MDGVLIIDKPAGWTSHDVVAKARGILKTRRIGHLGTLDPLATGVLPLVIERATRLAQFYTRSDKVYEGVVRFGWATDTYDSEGRPVGEKTEIELELPALERALDAFRGEFLQTPPPVSAKKIGGRRAYELARESKPVELAPVGVQVFELAVLEASGSEARLRLRCSGGTYMRSLAHDLGRALGCGAHLTSLRRLASGEFEIAEALSIARLETLAAEGAVADALIPPARMMPGFPSAYVDDLTAAQIRNGRNFPVSPFRAGPASHYVKAVTREGELVAVGEAVLPNLYHPLVVL